MELGAEEEAERAANLRTKSVVEVQSRGFENWD
jgi:hypothetical protein